MTVIIINPKNNLPLHSNGDFLIDSEEVSFPIISGVPRIAELENYTANFGKQWNKFDKTQLDRENDGMTLSKDRFFAETLWDQEDLMGKEVLEVGSGAGRFSKVILEHTKGVLYSVDFSDAVTANFKNNCHIAPDRFNLFQASVYEMPFPDNSFDKVFCFGVLQHTPDFEESVKTLISKTKPGGEIVVDFYPIKGWWTKVHAKYILRGLTKKMSHDRLLSIIEKNIDWLIALHFFLHKIGMGLMTRFLPLCNVKDSFPNSLSKSEIREWSILDTFDQYSPEHDHPQRIVDVVKMFERNGADVVFAGSVYYKDGDSTVVRGIKK
jgi:ubiquinone/menaquinone biosynthesis C-methylase UbiE